MNARNLFLSIGAATALLGAPAIASAAATTTKTTTTAAAPAAKMVKKTTVSTNCRNMSGKQLTECEAKASAAAHKTSSTRK